MPGRILGSGRTCGISFLPFLNSSAWWWLISCMFLNKTSCHKITHTNGYYGAGQGGQFQSVFPLTVPLPPLMSGRPDLRALNCLLSSFGFGSVFGNSHVYWPQVIGNLLEFRGDPLLMVSKVRSLIPESASPANLLEMQMTRPHPQPIAPSTEGELGNPVWQQALQVTLMHFAV